MSFLSKYLSYCENNECPKSYHLFSGLTILAALTGRRIWVEQGYWRHYGNLYTVLVGPPGNGKSVATMIGINLLNDIGDVPLASECASPRKLLEEMVEHQTNMTVGGRDVTYSPLVATPDELSNFISQEAALMLNTLTTIWYRNKHKYSTAHHGSFEVTAPCLTLLSCATPEWITSNLRSDVISGGFSRRVLWVYEGNRCGKVVPPSELIVTPAMQKTWMELISMGKQIQKITGEFRYDNGAVKYLDDWYVGAKKEKNNQVGGYAESKPGFVLKLAMMFALSEQQECVIRTSYVDQALEVLSEMEKNLHRVFEGVGRNVLNAVANQAIEFIKTRDNGEGVPDRLLRMTIFRSANSRELEEVLTHLCRTGVLLKSSLEPLRYKFNKELENEIALQQNQAEGQKVQGGEGQDRVS